MISVVVPAHNEEAVIQRTLESLTRGINRDHVEVIVVCNACTDRTASLARACRYPVQVIEISVASKTAALNAGDAVAVAFPRIYVDADVSLEGQSLLRIAEALEHDGVLFANPSLKMDLSESSWVVRAFYRVWTALPYNCTGGMVGTGVYALSRAGRSRFGAFPAIIADDAFVRYLFTPSERTRVDGAYSLVTAPRDLWNLIRIKTRSRLGGFQLRALNLRRPGRDKKSIGQAITFFLKNVHLWPAMPIYLLVNLITRYRARAQLKAGTSGIWERDESSRTSEVDEVLRA